MGRGSRRDRFISRRKMLALLGAAGVNLVAGCTAREAGAGGMAGCVVTPRQTEGPYFVDERLHRADIRSDPTDGSIRQGLPLALEIRVSAVGKTGCRPLPGAVVDIWHCDAHGIYSDVIDRRFSTLGKKFLRGYQITDASGSVHFATIYPGWYQGRTVHIHFKVRTDLQSAHARAFTSQLYFDDLVTDRVHAWPPYLRPAGSGPRTRNEEDGIFRDGGSALMLALAETDRGYAASFEVGLDLQAIA